AIIHSLKTFGQQKPIVVGVDDVVIAGNGTLEAALQIGWDKIAVIHSKLTGAEARAYAIADNRTAELAAWDFDLLSLELEDLRGLEFDLDGLGFGSEELEKLLGAAIHGEAGKTDPDSIPEPPDKATTQPGDLWLLGQHRLLCGDSACPKDVDQLLAGEPIHLVNTDPPYNVKVEPRSNNAIAAGLSSFEAPTAPPGGTRRNGLTHHQGFDVARQGSKSATTKKLRPKDRPLMNDFVSDDEFDRLLRAWFGNMSRVLLPGRGFYIWGGYANCANYPPVLKDCELYFSQAVIWVKEHPVLTRKDFMGNHEWCFYGWKEGAAHYFHPDIHNATDVWSVKKVNPQSMIHLTEKPVELAVRAMTYSSRPGENVLDLFGGSGSTLIAAEQTGRKAFLMELDALYCDVIVRRFEEFSGKKAQRRTNTV
ncbi:MAG: DNA methyltransferase, partial [Planctomycetota bacterium]